MNALLCWSVFYVMLGWEIRWLRRVKLLLLLLLLLLQLLLLLLLLVVLVY